MRDVLSALAEPQRVELLDAALMRNGERVTPKELAAAVDLPLSRVAYHVRILYGAGLLAKAGTGQARGATIHYYRPAVGTAELLAGLQGVVPRRYW